MSHNNSDWEILCTDKTLCTAGWFFMFWPGAINALTTFSVVFLRSAHMTGPASDQAKYLLSDPSLALLTTVIIGSYVFGAFAATKILLRYGFTTAMLGAAVPMLLAVMTINLGLRGADTSVLEAGRVIIAFLLPFSMGWQNSVTSQGKIGRTTHLTGELTDLGIAIARKNRTRVIYLFLKYLGFVAGGIAGYLGSQFNPALALTVIIAGYAGTVLVFHAIDVSQNAIVVPQAVFNQQSNPCAEVILQDIAD
jgi:uncharacterized membrane protein YoaK (UPF0700 family)